MRTSARNGWASSRWLTVVFVPTVALAACSTDSGGPDGGTVVERVTVTSNSGPIIPTAGSAQLTAVGFDGNDQPVPGVTFTWASANGAVVAVNQAGLADGIAVGFAGVTATTSTHIVGSITLQVVEVNLSAVATLAGDTFANAILDALSPSEGPSVRAAWAGCVSGSASGNISAIKLCTDAVQSSAVAATDPTDRALLASLVLYADEIERLIGV